MGILFEVFNEAQKDSWVSDMRLMLLNMTRMRVHG